MPHLKVEETPESKRGETWTCAGGRRDQEGRQGHNEVDDRIRCPQEVFMVGAVSRTLISVDRLQETGHDVTLAKNNPRIINVQTGEVMPLRKAEACLSWTCGYGFRQANRTFKSVRIL